MKAATVKEISRPGKNVIQIVSRKGNPLQEFPITRGVRTEIIAAFKQMNYKPTNNSPDWLKRGLNKEEGNG